MVHSRHFLSVGFPLGRFGMSLLQQQRILFIFDPHITSEETQIPNYTEQTLFHRMLEQKALSLYIYCRQYIYIFAFGTVSKKDIYNVFCPLALFEMMAFVPLYAPRSRTC